MLKDKFVAVQFRKKKIIKIFDLQIIGNMNMTQTLPNLDLSWWTIENCVSRNGKSFCIYEQFIAVRNLKQKCFEIVDILQKEIKLRFAYEDIWYYNNYHVLGSVFVFPHYMKVSFFDVNHNFAQLKSEGVDYDWYKNDDQNKNATLGFGTSEQKEKEAEEKPFQKKFVILKDSNIICYDSGEGRI